VEEYYGYRCSLCDLFIPYGCEPNDDEEEEEDWFDGYQEMP
jgi:hypothetical protein